MKTKTTTPKPQGDKSAIGVSIGLGLEALRKRAGLNMADLESACGLARGVVGRIERGERDIGASEIYEITRALDAKPEELFGLVPEPSKTGGEDGGKKPGKTRKILSLKADLTADEAGQLVRYFTRIADPNVRKRLLQVARTAAGP